MEDEVTIRRISEKKYFVGNNVNELVDSNIIYVIANGEQTDGLADKQNEICHILGNIVEGKINYLIDLDNCGKNSPHARKIWFELSEEEKTDKVAIFGMHPVAKVIASFVMKLSKKGNQQFFKNRKEALQWLKQA